MKVLGLTLVIVFVVTARCRLLVNGVPLGDSENDFKKNAFYLAIDPDEKANISSWETHVEELPHCHGIPMAKLTQGRWYKTQQGHYKYEPDVCQLHRKTGEAARWCLKKKNLVFVGDSITRYQYLHLAFFLSKLEHMDPYGDSREGPSLCMEKEWKNWDQFYHFSSAMLSVATNGCGTEICDCSRLENASSNMDTREYRSLLLSFPDECDKRFLGIAKGKHSLQLLYHQLLSLPNAVMAGIEAMRAIKESYRLLPPHVLVLYMGYHIRDLGPDHAPVLSEILKSGFAVNAKHNTTLLWKTTTPSLNDGIFKYYEQERDLAAAHSYQFYDVSSLVAASQEQGLNLFWDNLHFLPLVYENFNDVLLTSLCS